MKYLFSFTFLYVLNLSFSKILVEKPGDNEIKILYHGNIIKAIIDAIKGLPITKLLVIFDNYTDYNFINSFQKSLHINYIETILFNVTQGQYQNKLFLYLLNAMVNYQHAYCLFFCTHRFYEHVLIEMTEENIIHRNILLIFYWGTKPLKRYFVRSLHESLSTIVITNPRNDTYRLYYNQAVSHRKHHLSMVNWWSESGGLFRRPTLPSSREVYKDFKGKTFYIPVVHKPPWYFVKYNNYSMIVEGGRDDKLVSVLAKNLNFRYEYVDPMDQALSISNNSFQTALGLVWRRVEADFFLGDVTLTSERSTLVEFSFLTLADSGAFITHAPSRLNEALALVRPFHWRVWPPLIIVVIFAGPILYMLIALPDQWRHKPRIKSHLKVFSNCVWFTTSIFLKQTGKDPSKTDKCRIYIIILSIASTYVIIDMYSANLTSLLARPGREKPVNNLFQLEIAMKEKGYELFIEEHSSFHELLQNGTGIYGRLWSLMKSQRSYTVDSIENGVKLVKMYKNVVLIAGRETLYFDVQRFGASYFHLGEKLNTAYSAIALQIGCPYRDNINRILMAVFEAGILTKMTENEYQLLGKRNAVNTESIQNVNIDTNKFAKQNKHKVIKANEENNRLQPITIKMLQGAFYMLIIGHGTAVFMLIMEIIFYKYAFNKKTHIIISFVWFKKMKAFFISYKDKIIAWIKRRIDAIKEEIFLALLDYVE